MMIKPALYYSNKLGFSVVPSIKKRPLVKWTEYQNRKASDDEIKQWFTDNPEAGLAAVTGSISNIVVIDCDSQEAIEAFEDILPDLMVIPCVETTKGKHYYFATNDKILSKGHKDFKFPMDLKGEGSLITLPPSKGTNGKEYKWIVKPICKEDFPSFSNISINDLLKGGVIGGDATNNISHDITNITGYNILFNKGSRDNDLFHIANQLKIARTPDHEIMQVINILGKNCIPPLTEKEINEKVLSALKRGEVRETSLTNDIKGWIISHEGHFYITEISHDVTQYHNLVERRAVNSIVHRLWKEGFIEKVGERRGCYRKANTEIRKTKFIKEKIEDFPVILPFELNTLCKLYPKSVMVIAGSKGAGKTALSLKIALDNQNMMPVRYIHSEGGDEEFSERMQNMGITDEKQIRFEPIKCSRNFHDFVTNEKKIFVIDYLEIHKNFFEVAIPIKEIHDKLEQGIAIICLQKKLGALFGRGDEFSQEAARLYLSMDYLQDEMCTKITIVDAKAPKGDENLRGWFRKIKIKNKGTKLVPIDTAWYKPFVSDKPKPRKDWWDK